MRAAHDICGQREESNREQGQAQAMDSSSSSSSSSMEESGTQGEGRKAAAETTTSDTQSLPPLTLTVVPTTGGKFEIPTPRRASVDELRSSIARKLRVPPERIRLLHRDR